LPKILLVEQYFFPEGWGGAEIPRDIAVGLQEAGFAVDVLCSKDQYVPMPVDESQNPCARGVRIIRVPRIFRGSVHRFKSIRILWFCLYALPRLLLHGGADMYITLTNPLLIVPTVALVSFLRRRPLLIIAQDVYPEALFASGVWSASSLSGRLLNRVFAWSYRRAVCVVALGPAMRRRIIEKGVAPARVRVISNWATGALQSKGPRDNRLRREWGLCERFVLLYSGNLGVGHEFRTLLEGVQRARASGVDVHVVFIGGGVRLTETRRLVSVLDLEDRVTFKGFVPADVLPLCLGLADLAVVTLRQGFEGLIVPSKILGYMARAIPVLYVGPEGDVAEMIRDAECGEVCLPGDSEGVAQVLRRAANERTLLRQWGDNGQRRYASRYTRRCALDEYVELVRGVITRDA
jgi:glycosyltransferase involved in cell wall biosynthesis